MDAKDPRAARVLRFWFGSGGRDKRWFEKSDAFDREIRAGFLSLHDDASAGALAHWKNGPAECLALIVVLDQFPRNMFRGTARAFATDALALGTAQHAVASGFDRSMQPVERMFVYLPFEHAESLERQLEACALTKPLADFAETADVYRYAIRHRDVIARFGRFPHRNALLGRVSTPEETKFLQEPGSGF
jgi:uncharacterized protein (DUF924 family)